MIPLSQDALRIINGPAVKVGVSVHLLDGQLNFVEDITSDLIDGEIEYNALADIHRSCNLILTRRLRWGVDLVKLTMHLADSKSTVSCPVGVFTLTSPVSSVDEVPQSYDVPGYDRLFFLRREVGDDYSIAAGVTYYDALTTVFQDAGLSGVLLSSRASDHTLPVTKTWPLVPQDEYDPDQNDTPVSWLRVVNDLLRAVNFRGVFVNNDGRYVCAPYQSPVSRAPSYTFSDSSRIPILGTKRSAHRDVWGVPNRWVAIASNPPEGVVPSTANGLIQVRNNVSDGITSQDMRDGLVWPITLKYEVASSSVLSDVVDRRVESDTQTVTRFDPVVSFPFPFTEHVDVFNYSDSSLGVSSKVQVSSYRLPLSGEDMEWVWTQV